MVAINNYSVSLSLDASSYIRNSSLSRKETNALKREIGQARTPAESYKRSLDRLDLALKEGAIDLRTYNRLVGESKSKMQAAQRSAGGLATKLKGIASAYVGFHAVKGIIGSSVSLAADAEQTSVAFRVLLGDAEKAKAMLGNVASFASSTPFQLKELQDASRLLLAFGFSSAEAMQQLKTLGNIASGTNQPIGELAELLGKARVQNTIFSEDLNQLTGRGINVLDGLAKKLGTTTDQVKKFASQGKISFEDLNAVITDLSQTQFGGLMAEQSKTIAGQWSSIKDDVAAIGREFGAALLPAMKEMTKAARPFLQQFRMGLEGIFLGENMLDSAADRMNSIEEDRAFRERQLRNKDSIRAENAKGAAFGGAVGSGLGGAIDSGAGMLRDMFSGAASIGPKLEQLQSALVQTSWATTNEIVEAQKESPAIKAMEANSQEAYEFITGATRRQQEKEAKDEVRSEQIKKNGEKTIQLMQKFVDLLGEQGWGAI